MNRIGGKLKLNIIFALIAVIVIGVGVTFLDDIFSKKVSVDVPTPKDLQEEMLTITLPSGDHVLKDNMDNYLVIGLDSVGQMTSSESYSNNERADFLVLVSVDNENQTCKFLQINRDTMAYVPQLGVSGEKYGTAVEQIALAHTYGDGLATSCYNTVDAVSNMLYGVKIDYYIAMTMDAFTRLTDYVGGVNVTFDADYSEIDKLFEEGTTKLLNGEQALKLVRSRSNLTDSTNIARQKRENLFVDSFIAEMKKKTITTTYIEGAVETVSDYILTNANMNKLYDILTNLAVYDYGKVNTPEGRTNYANEFAEFYIDINSLDKLLVETFCVK